MTIASSHIASRKPKSKWLVRAAARLRANNSGVAVIEFALLAPIFITIAMFGIELGHLAITNLMLSEIATTTADNASRLEQTNNSVLSPTVSNSEVDSVLTAAMMQGNSMGFKQKGRVILSSLEMDPTNLGRQFVHWQRCAGALNVQTAYAKQGSNITVDGKTLTGMGKYTTQAISTNYQAVMFVEVTYEFNGIFGTLFLPKMNLRRESAFMVRDSRDLQQPTQSGLVGAASQYNCS